MASRRTGSGAVTLALIMLAVASGARAGDSAPSDLSEAAYDKGFEFATRDGRFELQLSSAIQFRYTYLDYDQAVLGNGTDYSNFYMRRARLWWRGHAFDPRFTFYFHLQLEPTAAVNSHDIWLEYAFSDLLRLGAGRNKIAYGLEFLNSGFGLNLVERSVMSGETDIDVGGSLFGDSPVYPGGGTARFSLHAEAANGFATGGMNLYRSQGVQLQGRRGSTTGPTFEYQVGIWQGRRTQGLSNQGNKHLYAARLGYYPLGWINWTAQGDGEYSPSYRVGIVVSAYTQSGEKGGGFDEQGSNVALQNRWRGFSADLEWGVERFDYALHAENFERQGWRAQLSYFVVPRRWEIAARAAAIQRLKDPTYAKALASMLGVAVIQGGDGVVLGLEERISEMTLGVNRFVDDWHQHKLQLDVSRLTRSFAADPDAVLDGEPHPLTKAPDQVDHRIRVMVQFKF